MCILEKESLTLEELMDYLVKREAIEITNINRIKKLYNDDESFDKLMKKIIDKDVKRFENLVAKKLDSPNISRVFYIILDIVQSEGEEIDPFDTLTKMLPSRILLYRGWTFSWVHGEGTLISIYNKENELVYQF